MNSFFKKYIHTHVKQAILLAQKTPNHTSPNPRVGCVIVKNNQIIGEGWHNGPETDHAEIMALKSAQAAGLSTERADLFVSLEPCCHYGRTPPCVTAIINAKIKRVFCATLDPNPKINSNGICLLKQAGIEVYVGFQEDEARNINHYYFYFMQNKRPYIIAKWAMSLDGYTVTAESDSKQISSQKSLEHSHNLRQKIDAILIGYKTALSDNPLLTTRYSNSKNKPHHPIRFILDSTGKSPSNLKIFSQSLPGKTIIVTTELSTHSWREYFNNIGIKVWLIKHKNKQVCLDSFIVKLYQNNIMSLLIEGGRTIHNAFMNKNLINEIHTYIAPILIGDFKQKQRLILPKGDIYVHGYC